VGPLNPFETKAFTEKVTFPRKVKSKSKSFSKKAWPKIETYEVPDKVRSGVEMHITTDEDESSESFIFIDDTGKKH